MSRRYVLLASGIVMLGVGVWLLVDRLTSYAQESRTWQKTDPSLAEDLGQAITATIPQGLVTLRVDFKSLGRAQNRTPTPWDGKLTVSGGRLRQIRLWQDDPRNSIDGNAWKLTTQRSIPWNRVQRARGHKAMPLQDGAIVIELAGTADDTELQFETLQGNFTVALRDVALGAKKGFLSGLAQISRMPNSAMILSASTEDDFPSAAVAPDGRLYVAYVAFTHGEDFRKRAQLPQTPDDWDELLAPAGGDQVLLLRLDGEQWTGPMAVTPPGQDVYRTAMAVDGDGRAWVVWSATQDGNWDLFARYLDGDRWSDELRLTTDAGPDTFPVAATDSSGNVWIAWQAFRGGNSDILAIRQDGDRFGEPIVVADVEANLWTPAVAASSDGQVAVAWDSYENGNYDVYCRVYSGEQFGDTIPIAVTDQAETRPAAAFDKQNRLWLAYEQSPVGWGKDWGALEQTGTALYRGRTVAVRVWADKQLHQPADDPAHAFSPWLRTASQKGRGGNLAVPRLAADASGRIWLAVRSSRLGTRTGVGTTWFEHVAWYEGDRWSNEIVCRETDNVLDNRPALVAQADGRVVMVNSADGRSAAAGRLPQWLVRELRQDGQQIAQKPPQSRWPDAVNNELMMAEFGPVAGGAAALPASLEPVDTAHAATPDEPDFAAAAEKEARDVARARAARTTLGDKTLRLWRGEFHRHTELSGDGGGDGLLLDMWRYGIDAAALDWIGNGDHDNGGGREYSWWITQKTTDMFQLPGVFTPMYTYERSCSYPDGHRNVVFPRRGIRTLPRLAGGRGKAMDELSQDAERPHTPDTQMLYDYLRHFDGICASHTSGTDMGTDWRDNDPKVEPIVEIYQGCRQSYEMPGAPRSNTAEHSLGGWRPFGFVSLALKKGFRLGFQASSDHISTHISYCNVWVEEPTREAIFAAMKARHVYGATDNIIADVQCGDHFMGDEFETDVKPKLRIHLIGTGPFAKVQVVKDGVYVHSTRPGESEVRFEWTDFAPTAGKTSYYYVRGEQEDGELVWVSPMWITYKP